MKPGRLLVPAPLLVTGGERTTDVEGWILPSGVPLSEFALQAGFLASRIWNSSDRGFAGSPGSPSAPRVRRAKKVGSPGIGLEARA